MGRFSKDQTPDLESALFHLKKAASCGHTRALCTLACIHLQLPHQEFKEISVEVSLRHTHRNVAHAAWPWYKMMQCSRSLSTRLYVYSGGTQPSLNLHVSTSMSQSQPPCLNFHVPVSTSMSQSQPHVPPCLNFRVPVSTSMSQSQPHVPISTSMSQLPCPSLNLYVSTSMSQLQTFVSTL